MAVISSLPAAHSKHTQSVWTSKANNYKHTHRHYPPHTHACAHTQHTNFCVLCDNSLNAFLWKTVLELKTTFLCVDIFCSQQVNNAFVSVCLSCIFVFCVCEGERKCVSGLIGVLRGLSACRHAAFEHDTPLTVCCVCVCVSGIKPLSEFCQNQSKSHLGSLNTQSDCDSNPANQSRGHPDTVAPYWLLLNLNSMTFSQNVCEDSQSSGSG